MCALQMKPSALDLPPAKTAISTWPISFQQPKFAGWMPSIQAMASWLRMLNFRSFVKTVASSSSAPEPMSSTPWETRQQPKMSMKKAGVPVVPGSDGLLSSLEEALELAEEAGYPILLKATAGGGGKGMRKVFAPEQMEDAWNSAQSRVCCSIWQ